MLIIESSVDCILAYKTIVVKTMKPIHQLKLVTKKMTAMTTSAMIGTILKIAWLQKKERRKLSGGKV